MVVLVAELGASLRLTGREVANEYAGSGPHLAMKAGLVSCSEQEW